MTLLEAQHLTFKLMRLSEKFGVICSFLTSSFVLVKKKKYHQLLKLVDIYKNIRKSDQNNYLPTSSQKEFSFWFALRE